jgi:hypothetical protein
VISRRHGEHRGEDQAAECRRVRQNAGLKRVERWGGETLASFPTRWRGGCAPSDLIPPVSFLPSFLRVLRASVRDLIAGVLFISQRHEEHEEHGELEAGGALDRLNSGEFSYTWVRWRRSLQSHTSSLIPPHAPRPPLRPRADTRLVRETEALSPTEEQANSTSPTASRSSSSPASR